MKIHPTAIVAADAQLEEGVEIGPYSIIGPEVKIGKNTVIGAGSVVVKDIPDGVLAVGNPCRVVKTL